MRTSGGGGLGDPLDRSTEAIRNDLAEGRITPDAASSVYGLETPE
jgi:N-methylhydantoinase B